MPSRRKTREFVLQVLFAADVQDRDPEDLLPLLEDHFSSEQEDAVKVYRVMKGFARDLVATVSRDRIAIDRVIRELSHHWKLYRMNRVDRSILRMAIAEMTSFPEIPGRVTLDVFDVQGKLVRRLRDQDEPVGVYDVRWDGRNDQGKPLSSGIYFYRLTVNGQAISTKKMILLK